MTDHKLVPREPTQEMLDAGQRAVGEVSLKYDFGHAPHCEKASAAWTAMVDAAPSSAPVMTEEELELVADRRARLTAQVETKAQVVPTTVEREILTIMEEYDRQMERNRGYVDTPGGLEHMGDVWRLLDSWRDEINKRITSTPTTAQEPTP